MIKLNWWQIGIGLGIAFIFLSWVGYNVMPSYWYAFPLVPFGLFILYRGLKYGWKLGLAKLIHGQKYVKALTPEQAEQKILEYCNKNDFIIMPTSPKEGNFSITRVAGNRDTPFLIWKRKISLSKLKVCWALLICDRTTGGVSARGLNDASFTEDMLDSELEKTGGVKKYIEKIQLPEAKGPIVERYRQPEVEGE